MKNKNILLLPTRSKIIIGFFLIISLFPLSSYATTISSIEDATVNIYCRLKAGKQLISTSGSGVIIDPRGVVLTNAHVAQYLLLAQDEGRVSGWCSIRTGSPADETYTAKILYIPPTWVIENAQQVASDRAQGTGEHDFALLYITDTFKSRGSLPNTFPYIPLATSQTYEEGDTITIAGYPIEDLSFSEIRNDLEQTVADSYIKNIQSFTGQTVDVLSIGASKANKSGVSGGPIIDEAGTVIGIVSTKSESGGEAIVRAITTSYIQTTIQTEAYSPLQNIINGNLDLWALVNRIQIPDETIETLVKKIMELNRK